MLSGLLELAWIFPEKYKQIQKSRKKGEDS